MNDYLEILQNKANKIDADISMCGFDKECITNAIAAKIKNNLKDENIDIIKAKAIQIEAEIPDTMENKTAILFAIEEQIKTILEKENEHFTSMEAQKNFIPLDLG